MVKEQFNSIEFNPSLINLEISIVTEKYTVVDISNELKCFQFAVWSVCILIVRIFISSLLPLFIGTLPFRGFIPFDRLVKALFLSNSLV